MPEPTPTPWLRLLEAARRVMRHYGDDTDDEKQATLDLATIIGEIDRMLERQRGSDPPEWLTRR